MEEPKNDLNAPVQHIDVLPVLVLNLKRFVNESGLSHSRVAQILGVSSVTLLAWIYGRAKPRRSSLERIEIFLAYYGPRYLHQCSEDSVAEQFA